MRPSEERLEAPQRSGSVRNPAAQADGRNLNAIVVHNGDIQRTELGNGVSRKVLAHDERMMVVEVRFETGGVGAAHTHPHAQSTYVVSGKFRFTISGEPVEVGAGDSIVFAPGVEHGALCQEAGIVVDIFAPMREDFI